VNKLFNALRYFYLGLQLVVGIVMPFVICLFLAGWLKTRFGLGNWITIVGIIVAFLLMVGDVYSFGKMMLRMLDKKDGRGNADERNGKK